MANFLEEHLEHTVYGSMNQDGYYFECVECGITKTNAEGKLLAELIARVNSRKKNAVAHENNRPAAK